MYRKINERFFDGRLPTVSVRYSDDLIEEHADGIYTLDGEILIASYLRVSYGLTQIVLIHEMVHVELGDTYRGYPGDGGHGMRFQARLVELFNAGVYDNLL